MSHKRSNRRPNSEELALWQKVVETAQPIKRVRAPSVLTGAEASKPSPPPVEIAPVTPFRVGQKLQGFGSSRNAMTVAETQPGQPPVRMDKKAFTNMKRGKARPEATLDLHGMTLDRAHGAVIAFVLRSYSRDLRLALVVTGKGKRDRGTDIIPERQGVLRHHLPHWLSVPPLSQMVLQVTEAHGKHGGGGAYYVYLKRRR